ncbi:PsbP-related protein [candidate division KSB1 bacterium]
MKTQELLCIIFSITVLSVHPVHESTAQDARTDFHRYENSEAGFSIEIPDNWTIDTRLHGSEDTQEQHTFYVFSGPEETPGNRTGITVIISPNRLKSPQDYMTNLLSSYASSFKEFTLDSKRELIIDGRSFASFTIHHTLASRKHTMMTVFTIIDNTVYQLNAVAPSEHFDKDKALIDKIAATFRIIKEDD